jgi:DNA-binding transcriptional MerR regulator
VRVSLRRGSHTEKPRLFDISDGAPSGKTEAASKQERDMTQTFTITQLTKELGVTSRTLRFYEEEKLLSPLRRGQTRLYRASDRDRILLILRGRRVGFSVAELRELLDLYDGPSRNVTQMIEARRKFCDRIALLEQQRVDLEKSLSELRDGVDSIDTVLAKSQDATNAKRVNGAAKRRFKKSSG